MARKKVDVPPEEVAHALGAFGGERRRRAGEGELATYQVLIEEVVQYVVKVEAHSIAEAGEGAMQVLQGAADALAYWHAVSEREVAHVYRGDQPLPPTC